MSLAYNWGKGLSAAGGQERHNARGRLRKQLSQPNRVTLHPSGTGTPSNSDGGHQSRETMADTKAEPQEMDAMLRSNGGTSLNTVLPAVQ